jgi:hypothetical protein
MLMRVGLSARSDRTAAACSCIGRAEPCEAVWTSGPIFRGRVVAIGSVPRPVQPGLDRMHEYTMQRVTRAVADWLRGDITTPQVEVLTGLGGGDCGYAFREGVEYLVHTCARCG